MICGLVFVLNAMYINPCELTRVEYWPSREECIFYWDARRQRRISATQRECDDIVRGLNFHMYPNWRGASVP